MLNRIIRFSLHHRPLVLLATVVLTACGLYSAFHAQVDVFPDLNAPTVVVMTEAQGMAAQEVEQFVTFPIEAVVNGATHVRRVRSSSTSGFSVVWVEFDWGTDIFRARQVVSEKLATVVDALPQGAGTPTLGPQSSVLGELLIVGLTADTTSMAQLRTLADWSVRPRLLATGGVAQVAVLGGEVKEYQIQLHPLRMKHYGITLQQVLDATEQMNRNMGGGVVSQYANEYLLLTASATVDVGHIASCCVGLAPDGHPILLSDVAHVCQGAQQPLLGRASERGREAVLLTVSKQPGAGTRELTALLEAELERIRQDLPPDVHVSSDIFRQSRFIDSAVHHLQRALAEGAVFVAVVLILFLGNVRTTIISLLTIPVALLSAVLALDAMGMGINTMSLGGMAIAVGSLVDDAIVDVENVWKQLHARRLLPPHERRPVLEVVYEASRQVRLPILYSTLIIIVSFVPLFCLEGMEGMMLAPLGVAFITALCASTLVALTLTPVLCSVLMKADEAPSGTADKADSALAHLLKCAYRHSLEWALRHARAVAVGAAVLLAGALVVATQLGSSFLPAFNEGSLTVLVSAQPGISLAESDRMGRLAEQILMQTPGVLTVGRKTGRAELDEHALGVNTSELEAPYALGDMSRKEFLDLVRARLSVLQGVNVEIGQPISHRLDHTLSGTKAGIAIKVFGPDLGELFRLGNRIKTVCADIPGIADLNVEQLVERPQLSIAPDRVQLAQHGISMADFNRWAQVCLAGQVVSQVYDQERAFDLVVRAGDAQQLTIEQIMDMPIGCAHGQVVPLSQVAHVRSTTTPAAVNRENAQRRIVVSANTSGRDLRGVVDDIRQRIERQVDLPEGYYVKYGGQFESEARARATLAVASAVSVVVIFLLLFMQFGHVGQSLLILCNLPLALIGGVAVLACTTGESSVPALIGFISLFGVATRNGMLLVAQYNHLLSAGHITARQCVLTGSVDRLNPILMTALTSALALVPLALNGDAPGNEIQSPMAKVILGGLVSSTLLNAYVVPAIQLLRMERKTIVEP